jgi:hypothetical protein
MSIKMSLTCSRCRREDLVELNEFAEAKALEEKLKKKGEVLEKLQAFVKTLPADDLPDFFAVLGDKVLVHNYLCDPKDEKKRSCAKRVGELLAGIDQIEERKPRAKKAKEEPAAE